MNACQECGKRARKHATRCRSCERKRHEELIAGAREQVATGRCPHGHGLKRNLSLTGWWQCEQFGAEQFRARRNEPACDFQTFTE